MSIYTDQILITSIIVCVTFAFLFSLFWIESGKEEHIGWWAIAFVFHALNFLVLLLADTTFNQLPLHIALPATTAFFIGLWCEIYGLHRWAKVQVYKPLVVIVAAPVLLPMLLPVFGFALDGLARITMNQIGATIGSFWMAYAILKVDRKNRLIEKLIIAVGVIAAISGAATVVQTIINIDDPLYLFSEQKIMERRYLWLQVIVLGGALTLAIICSDLIEHRRRLLAREKARSYELEGEVEQQKNTLLQSEKMNTLGTMLVGVAHELNNPLSVVVASAFTLSKKSYDKDTNRSVQRILKAADQCTAIVKTFLSFSRKQEFRSEVFSVSSLVEEVSALARATLKADNISLIITSTNGKLYVLGNKPQVIQAILNLIMNARDALVEHQREKHDNHICIRYRPCDGGKWIEFTVEDNGPGIPVEKREKIFEPFYTSKKIRQGTGLGLSIVHNIIEQHGGSVELKSDVSRGACFCIKLPASQARKSDAETDKASFPPLKKHSILIVDDDLEVLETLSDTLVLMNQHVQCANSAELALRLIQQHKFDIILSDLRMLNMDGVQFYQEVANRWPSLANKFGFITATSVEGASPQSIESTGRPVITKPFDQSDIIAMIHKLGAQ